MKKIFCATVFLLSILHNIDVFAEYATDEPMTAYMIMSLTPVILIAIIFISIILLIKKREKHPKTSGRNPLRIEFENTCTKYERGTLFLKLYVIYFLMLHMIQSVLMIIGYIINESGDSMPVIIIGILFQLIAFFCAYQVRKNAMMLNKRGYKFLIAYYCVMNLLNTIGKDFISIILHIVILILVYIYMKKRASLFNGEKNKYKDVNTINE